jgi:hypothetical protein
MPKVFIIFSMLLPQMSGTINIVGTGPNILITSTCTSVTTTWLTRIGRTA